MTHVAVRSELLYAWNGPSLLITNPRGECGDDHTLSGFIFREARYLRTLRLLINGEAPWLCEAAVEDPAPCGLCTGTLRCASLEVGGAASLEGSWRTMARRWAPAFAGATERPRPTRESLRAGGRRRRGARE